MLIGVVDLGMVSGLFLGIILMFGFTIWLWAFKPSSFNNRQKIYLTLWLLITIIMAEFLILILPSHDRNIMIIVVTACICFWAVVVFRDGNFEVLDDSPQSIAMLLLLLAIVIIFYGFDYIYPINDITQIHELINQMMSDFYANIGSELIGVAITIIVLDRLNDRKNIKARLDDLKVQMRSPNSDTATEAIQMLDAKGWLEDMLKEDTNIILPDGTKWASDRDMREFTHPRKWQEEQKEKAIQHNKEQTLIENYTSLI